MDCNHLLYSGSELTFFPWKSALTITLIRFKPRDLLIYDVASFRITDLTFSLFLPAIMANWTFGFTKFPFNSWAHIQVRSYRIITTNFWNLQQDCCIFWTKVVFLFVILTMPWRFYIVMNHYQKIRKKCKEENLQGTRNTEPALLVSFNKIRWITEQHDE